jgi:4-hydroxy-tetrahydrodipicolinate reductase
VTSILLIGHGRMGRLVEALAESHQCRIAGVVTRSDAPAALASGDFGDVDVAIDFSHASGVKPNLEAIAKRGWNAVIGTTGWQDDLESCRAIAARANVGVLAAANFSIGMHVFGHAVRETAKRFAALPDVGAWIHEIHHSAKKDAPSGTAILLRNRMREAGYDRPIDVSSTRAGSVPGTHEVGFDAPAETVTLVHTVRDRAVFAHGALEAAQWIKGRRGWFTMEDLVG